MRLIIFGLFLRILISFWNAYFGPTLGAEGDALVFHSLAVDYSNDMVWDKFRYGWIYSFGLGILYFLTVDSLFLGCLLSCFVWLLSAIILDKTLALLQINKVSRNWALFIYAVLPSSVLFTSVTLREVYQLLFVTLAIYSSLKIYLKDNRGHWIFLILAVIGMSIFHVGLVAFGLFLLVLVYYFQQNKLSQDSA